MRDVILYLTDTMADWEYGHVTAGIADGERRRPGRYRFRALADGQEQVTTKGGLRTLSDGDLDEADFDSIAMLILPGADTWERGHDKALNLARRLLEAGKPVAAICGATLGLARTGLLDERRHTSNARIFLEQTGYAGASGYQDEAVVDDRGLITATSLRPLEFANAIFTRLETYAPEVREAWYQLYRTGEEQYFYRFMQA